jgi:hypothetical protein
VIRECIENQFRLSRDSGVPAWTEICSIRIFGAAHVGFRFSVLKDLSYTLSPDMITSLPRIWRAFSDLQSTSNVLIDLRRRTEKLAKVSPKLKCFRAMLLYGTEEDVVIPGEYDCDYALEWQSGANHTQVCKPDDQFTDPINFVTSHAFTDSANA